jgi:hypothetical protein
MAKISNLYVGQILYSVRRVKVGNTNATRGALYTVKVISIAEDGKSITASWNSNPPITYREASVNKLLVNKPKPKCKVLGMDSY